MSAVADELTERNLCVSLVRFGAGERLLSLVDGSHFEKPAMAMIASTAVEMLRDGEPVTSEALYERLVQKGRGAGAEALRFLEHHALPSQFNALHAATRLREMARRRGIVALAHRIEAAGMAGDWDGAREIMRAALESPTESDERYRVANGMQMVTALMEMVKVRMAQPSLRVDGKLSPVAREMTAGQMVTVGGETGAGKSSLALYLTNQWGQATGSLAGVVSLEDRHGTWGDRWQARASGVSLLAQDPSTIGHAFEEVAKAREDIRSAPDLLVAELQDNRLETVLDAMRDLVRRGCSMLVVDYVQEITVRSSRDRKTEVSDAARAIKGAAKTLRVPLILCSQLSRGQGAAEPTKKSLKESGDLENMSEAIVLLWRRSDQPGTPTHGKVAKLKNGLDSDRSRFDIVRSRAGAVTGASECSADDDAVDSRSDFTRGRRGR